MKAWQANEIAMRGHRKVVAAALRCSTQLVTDFCVPPAIEGGAGVHSPTEKVLQIVAALARAGATDPLYLVRFICGEVGGIFVRLADMPRSAEAINVARPTKEFADYLGEVATRLGDKDASPDDARAIGREIDELICVLATEREGLRVIERADDEQQVYARRGPHRSELRGLRLRSQTA